DALTHAIQLDPTDPIALGLMGVLARSEGKLPEARKLLEAANAGAPDSAALIVDLGNVAAQEGKTHEALAAWAKALKLEPKLAERDKHYAVVAGLGAPDMELPGDADGLCLYMLWSDKGVDAVVRADKVVEWGVFVPATAKTAGGVGIGSSEADVRKAWGEPPQ